MPLPVGGNTPWPPPEFTSAFEQMAVDLAWYSGNPDRLALVYGGGGYGGGMLPPGVTNHPAQYKGGVVGTVARAFWGDPIPTGERPNKLHLPVAEDIARVSATLLWAEPPAIICEDKTTQEWLDESLGRAKFDRRMLAGAEVQSAVGGVYLVITWDDAHAAYPFLRVVHQDAAVPEFRWGDLSAVTLWQELGGEKGEVWRHLERHETGQILHGLYVGTVDELGVPYPLSAHPATAHLADVVPGITGRLTAGYIPNALPNRQSPGSPIGRSDYTPGIRTLMDALDDAYTSWMNDVDSAKSKLIVPESYLMNNGPGRGASFDSTRRLFVPVPSLGDVDASALQIEMVQFEIRHEAHKVTCADLYDRIVRAAGYGPATVGDGGDMAMTATESNNRDRLSANTTEGKSRYWRDELRDILETLLACAVIKFGAHVKPQRPQVQFRDTSQEAPLILAQTVFALHQADAISLETRVRMAHPGWREDDVTAEIKRIKADQKEARDAIMVAEPGMGLPGPGLAGDSADAGDDDELAADQGGEKDPTGPAGGNRRTGRRTPPAT